MSKFYDPQVNLYVKDVKISEQFYIHNFGFVETFRTPETGNAIHVELTLGQFKLGIASISSAESMHHLKVGTGLPRCEVVIWTDETDIAYNTLIKKGITSLSEPHTFIETIRAAWVSDPDDNPIQIVSKVK